MTEQSAAGRPFYVQVSYYAQHLSVVTRDSLFHKYEQKGRPDRGYTQAWAAMMEELDLGVGRILDTIEALGIKEDTYVFFTTDNGGRGTVPGGDQARLLLTIRFPVPSTTCWKEGSVFRSLSWVRELSRVLFAGSQ